MSPSEDITTVLEDLAAGRIDASEAARRIDALSVTNEQAGAAPAEATPSEARTDYEDAVPGEPAAEPSVGQDPTAEVIPEPFAESTATVPDAAEPAAGDAHADAGSEELPHPDAWSASTDRPQTAGQRRESFRTDAGAGSTAQSGATGRAKPPATSGVDRLSVRAVGRRVRIVGEPSVATVSADGPHVLRRNGSVLEVSSDGEFGASIDGFQLLRATRSLDDFRSLGLGKELLLKVNPALLVDVEVTAGSLNTEGVPRLGSVRVTAGGARLLDVAEITDALVQAGQATVKAAITTGRSRIRVESGSLSLQLADASNVTVSTDAQLGKVSWGGAHAGFTGDEVVLGNGSARLVVEVVMGHASVRAGTVPAGSGAA